MRVVPAEALDRLMRRALASRGVSPEHAGFVARALLDASRRGIDTHGVRLFPTYLRELDGGRSHARPRLAWSATSPTVLRLDAGAALGPVAAKIASREAVALAQHEGVGVVSVANSNHCGAVSSYTVEMARGGVVAFGFSNSDALVAPFGGTRPLIGTNPMSFAAAGADGEILCLDMATSQVAYSRVEEHRRAGRPLEPGWALDGEGRDAAELPPGAEVVALQPLGGYKGQGLGMMVEVLCALLADMPLDHELAHLYAPPYDEPRRVAHLFLALHVARFTDPERFAARLAALLGLVRAQEGVGGGVVRVPGDPEREAETARRQSGIPLTEADLEALQAVDEGGELGPPPEARPTAGGEP